MATVHRTVRVRGPVGAVWELLSDREAVMSVVSEFGRTRLITAHEDGSQEWDVFIVLGAMHVGGRVLVDPPGDGTLTWHSTSGIANSVAMDVAVDGEGSLVTARVELQLEGAITGRLTAVLVRSVIGRYLDAMLENLRHRIEFGE